MTHTLSTGTHRNYFRTSESSDDWKTFFLFQKFDRINFPLFLLFKIKIYYIDFLFFNQNSIIEFCVCVCVYMWDVWKHFGGVAPTAESLELLGTFSLALWCVCPFTSSGKHYPPSFSALLPQESPHRTNSSPVHGEKQIPLLANIHGPTSSAQ
jgi:hypothetical protein